MIAGKGIGLSASANVSPMVTSASPAMETISPGPADVGRHLFERFGHVHLGDLRLLNGAVDLAPGDGAALLELAVVDAADGEPAHIGRGAEVADQRLRGRRLVELGRRDVVDDGLEERRDVGALDAALGADPAGARIGVEDGERDLVLVGIEVQEQLLDLVDHLFDPGIGPVDLVDDQDDRQPRLEGLAEHETGLGERALGGVDQQEDAVDHGQAALHLATEVGVAGRVDDVHLHPAPPDGRVLGQDGDALLALEVTRVHDAVGHLLVGAERTGLAQHGVDERRLAVVDVGHDGHIPDVIAVLAWGLQR